MNNGQRGAASPRKVLVIGGTLFIGRTLVAELLKAGHEVCVLHRKPGHDLGKRVSRRENGGFLGIVAAGFKRRGIDRRG